MRIGVRPSPRPRQTIRPPAGEAVGPAAGSPRGAAPGTSDRGNGEGPRSFLAAFSRRESPREGRTPGRERGEGRRAARAAARNDGAASRRSRGRRPREFSLGLSALISLPRVDEDRAEAAAETNRRSRGGKFPAGETHRPGTSPRSGPGGEVILRRRADTLLQRRRNLRHLEHDLSRPCGCYFAAIFYWRNPALVPFPARSPLKTQK